MGNRLDTNQQQTLAAMKVNHIPGCISELRGSGLRGMIVLHAQHSDSSGILNLVFRSLPLPTKEEMLTNWKESRGLPPQWLRIPNPKERLWGAGVFHLQKGRLQGAGSGTI